jgi:hypothetical protein
VVRLIVIEMLEALPVWECGRGIKLGRRAKVIAERVERWEGIPFQAAGKVSGFILLKKTALSSDGPWYNFAIYYGQRSA